MKESIHKPNDPIVCEETVITHTQDQCLPKPCPVRAILRLSPRLVFSIDSDELPRIIFERYQKIPFFISLQGGGKVRVRLGSYDPNSITRQGFKGSLVPVQTPCTVVPMDAQIQSVRFSVLNFKQFHGTQDRWSENYRLGIATLKTDYWQIDIKEKSTLDEDLEILKPDGGYAVTHDGSIWRLDNSVFTVKEVICLLDGLRAFLSFARGAGCGITLVKGIDKDGKETPIVWGTRHAEPWIGNRNSWLTSRDGGDSLSEAFPGFWRLFSDKEWNDIIRRVIDLYLISNNSPFHVGIILSQAALESLSYKINGRIDKSAKMLRKS